MHLGAFFDKWRPAVAIPLQAELKKDLGALISHEVHLAAARRPDPAREASAAQILGGLLAVPALEVRALELSLGLSDATLPQLAVRLADLLRDALASDGKRNAGE